MYCRIHERTTTTVPDKLLHGAFGCLECARASQIESTYLGLDDVIDELQPYLPEHVSIVDLIRTPKGTKLVIECERHGKKEVTKGYLTRSEHGCPECGNEHTGYAGYRIRRLLESGDAGRDTWLAVMEVEVFGIVTLKVGVTTRSIEDRYKWYLRKIFFSTKLRELDALLLENEISRAFKEHSDQRVFKAGMRSGERWSGDTECYWLGQKEQIIEFIRKRLTSLEKSNEDYWAEFARFELPSFGIRDVSRSKSDRGKPISVRCIETGVTYASIADAQRATGIRNISSVVRQERRTAGGFIGSVRRIDSVGHFAQSIDAGTIRADSVSFAPLRRVQIRAAK